MQIACRCNRALLLCHRGSASSVHAVYQHRPSRIPRQDGRGTSFASHAISEDSNGDAYWSRESTDVETAGSTEEDVTVVPDEIVLLTPEPAIDTAQRVVEDDVVVVKRRGVKRGPAGAHGSGHRAPDDLGPR